MPTSVSLVRVFDGWAGYQTSLLHAVEPLTPDQSAWRPADHRRSVAELVRHVSLGRVTWFSRMNGPGLEAARARVPRWFTDADGSRHTAEDAVTVADAAAAVEWLTLSWEPVRAALDAWTVADLAESYPHRFRGTDYLVSRQWTVWRVMAHDVHHGGQLAMMLAMQGVKTFELGALSGHIVEPPRAPPKA